MFDTKQEVIEETGSFPTSNLKDLIEVNEYGLFAFCSKIQELIKQGYEIDLKSNVRAPMSYGTMFVAYMTRNITVPTTDSEGVDVPTPESEVLPTQKEPVLVISPPLESEPKVPVKTESVVEKLQSEPKRKKAGAAE